MQFVQSLWGVCQQGIAAQREALNAGQTITILLAPKGYTGNVALVIEEANQAAFQADWRGRDLSRFPARLKAAATALRNCGCRGGFAVSYADGGLLSIKQENPQIK